MSWIESELGPLNRTVHLLLSRRRLMSFINIAQITTVCSIAAALINPGAVASEPAKPLKFQERQVAGKASDLMIVRYLRLEGTNEQIGAKLAEIARDRHGSRGDRAQGDYAAEQMT